MGERREEKTPGEEEDMNGTRCVDPVTTGPGRGARRRTGAPRATATSATPCEAGPLWSRCGEVPTPPKPGLAPAPATGDRHATCAGAIAHPMRPDGRVSYELSPTRPAGGAPTPPRSRSLGGVASRRPSPLRGVEHTALHRRPVGTERFRRRGCRAAAVAVPNGGGGLTSECGLVPPGLPADTDA